MLSQLDTIGTVRTVVVLMEQHVYEDLVERTIEFYKFPNKL